MPIRPVELTMAVALLATPAADAQTSGSGTAATQKGRSASTASTPSQQAQAAEPSERIRGERPIETALVAGADQIASNPAAYYGLRVSVHGSVDERLGPRSFTVDDPGWYDADWFSNDLVVIIPQSRAAQGSAVTRADVVTAVGTVRPLVRTELERDYDWFNWNDIFPDVNVEIEGRPALIADLARKSNGTMLTKADTNVTRIFLASPGDIAQVPGRFYGRIVSTYAEVADVWSPRAFTLDEDRWFAGPDVLVFNPGPAGYAHGLEDEHVAVFGVVRPFLVSEFERDYDWFDAGDYTSFNLESLERRPAIVASSIVSSGREFVIFSPDLTLDRAEARAAETRGRGKSSQAQPGTERPRTTDQPPSGQPARGQAGARAGLSATSAR